MRKLRNQNGAITIIVLVSILFMVSFLISSYLIVANKVKTQKEMVEQTRAIYDNSQDVEEIYNSYFEDKVIPIYTVEQLLKIGTDEENVVINGKYYKFSNNESTMYVLMNDITFNAYDYDTSDSKYYWEPIGEKERFLAGFNGNNHKIEVRYQDLEGDEYSIIYSHENNFSEPEYKVKIIPRILTENGEILSDATIYTALGNNEFIAEQRKGEIDIYVKRLAQTKIYASCNGYKNSGTATITIDNPMKKEEEINLVLGKYIFKIITDTPGARIFINNIERDTVFVNKGEIVNWRVEANNYIAREESITINDDMPEYKVNLDIIKYTLNITPIPADATVNVTSSDGTVLVNAQGTQSVELIIGTNVNWSVSKLCYYGQSGSATMNSDTTVPVTLTLKPEQTKVLTPTQVNSSSVTSASSAKADADSGSAAYGSGKASLEWVFIDTAMNPQAKIVKIVARYKIASTIVGSSSTITLKSASRTCFTREISDIGITGATYGSEATDLPTGAELNSGLTLKANKNNTGSANFMRWYGADLTITYIDP